MVSSLRERFLLVEERFFTAFAGGKEALSLFEDCWESLHSDYTLALEQRRVDPATRSLAQSVASRIAVIADTLMSLHETADETLRSSRAQCEDILAKAEEDGCLSSDGEPQGLDSLATEWLLQNIHDPYPSANVKGDLAGRTHTSVKDVQDWFANARRRIGWTTLCREKFGGSRRDTSAAAFQAYAQDLGDSDLSPSIRQAFLTVKANAHSIPRGTLSTQQAAVKVEGLSEEVIHGTAVRDQMSQADTTPKAFTFDDASYSSHVSIPFLTQSAVSVPPDVDEDDTTPPPPIAGCKRRFDASNECINEVLHATSLSTSGSSLPAKRARYMADCSREVPLDGEVLVCWESSAHDNYGDWTRPIQLQRFPPHSQPGTATDVGSSPCSFSPVVSHIPAACGSLLSRKRRLSDAALPDPPKRPRGFISYPRKQTVSDPLPTGSSTTPPEVFSTDDALQPTFNVPETIGMGNYSPSAFDAQFTAFSEMPSCNLSFTASQFDISDADLAVAASESFDLSAFDPVGDPTISASAFPMDSVDPSSSESSISSSPASRDFVSSFPDYASLTQSDMEWTPEWRDFMRALNLLSPSPSSSPSSQSSLSNNSTSLQFNSDLGFPSDSDNVNHTLFGSGSSFTSPDLLSDIGQFSSLHIPLESVLTS